MLSIYCIYTVYFDADFICRLRFCFGLPFLKCIRRIDSCGSCGANVLFCYCNSINKEAINIFIHNILYICYIQKILNFIVSVVCNSMNVVVEWVHLFDI